MRIGGFLPTTMLDYPGRLACTVFTCGCNMRCPFCQNASLVLPQHFEDPLDPEEILSKIRKRKSILEGVCISGGEPTLHPDLADLIIRIKDLGLLVKLDTNGSSPSVIKSLYKEGLIDMVAMDIKSAPSNYPKVSGCEDMDISPYMESAGYIMGCGIEYEFRTTLVKGLHTLYDMEEIGRWIPNAKAYVLQSYKESSGVISVLESGSGRFSSFSDEELDVMLKAVQKYIPCAALRYAAS